MEVETRRQTFYNRAIYIIRATDNIMQDEGVTVMRINWL